ncbi:hypothetical protein Goari_013710, partial [Gossypium aridum]|nr:hypothetical protein [Gossypium aridum]
WGIDHNSSCPNCGCEIEDTLHALKDCSAAKKAWLQSFLVLSLRANCMAYLEKTITCSFFNASLGRLLKLLRFTLVRPNSSILVIEATVTSGDRRAFVSGVLHDQYGNWILGKGFKRATIQTDNLEIARALQQNVMTDSDIIVLRSVRRIMKTEGQWCIRYVPRDFNKVVDCLAKLSLAWNSSL